MNFLERRNESALRKSSTFHAMGTSFALLAIGGCAWLSWLGAGDTSPSEVCATVYPSYIRDIPGDLVEAGYLTPDNCSQGTWAIVLGVGHYRIQWSEALLDTFRKQWTVDEAAWLLSQDM